ncbi:hypothetical protein Cs7R123_53960 [Catellatospora sp. TT07R-123]|uniref:DUF305 domain-containing protein n=1 Tax=Catellatospora sp. TT07R-123 TaxID=2733863 RepID=UPI001B2B95A7|nr:DUF305 domain-containing protein [Catellatospora sp. TT07R-123]GHJ48054.1 hypothetical protein Cs7R123_53960 [Catellatospora sp. TT07R-123]
MKRIVALAAAVLVLAGCGSPEGAAPAPQPLGTQAGASPLGSPPPPVSPSGAFNDTDVMFLQMMAAQYGPAAELLELARNRGTTQQVRELAAAIAVTQADEARTMRDWLAAWKQPASPAADPNLHAGHGGMNATGPKEIAALRDTPAADFDKTFLNLLIGHQHQAVEYARMELGGGIHSGALELATRVDQTRTSEITMMLGMVA